jgi:hypothetical protein
MGSEVQRSKVQRLDPFEPFHEKAKSRVQFTDNLFFTSPDRHASIRTFVEGLPAPWCMLKSVGGAAI